MTLHDGTRLGAYRIIASLGAGGMGEVYRARDERLDRDVALKVLPESAAAHPDRRELFEREAKAIAALRHPNIVTIHSIEESDGIHFITMELVEGKPLTELISPAGVSVDRFLEIAVPLAEAVASAHAKGVIHRDLKPANLMLDENGLVKVLDFGLAKLSKASSSDAATEPLTRPGSFFGTPAYMSPEQITGGSVDNRSDLFSLGIIFYELLAGARPFRGEHPAALLHAIVHEEPHPLPERTGALADLVQRCLRKAPRDRFATAGELGAALRASTRGEARPWPQAAAPRKTSIAVLPFVNVSPDPENEYFADGMTEEIIATLGRLPALRVAARTSSFSFKNKNADIKQVGAALQVGCVLEGSVRRAKNRVRIQAQLVSVDDGYPLWSERYERELTDIFDLQDEIASDIARKLEVSLLDAPVRARRTDDVEAYDLYLKGRFHWEQRGDGLRRGRAYFEQAIARDPRFARAYAGLSDAHTALAIWGTVPSDEALPRARDAALRAIDLDPSLAEAHAALAQVQVLWDRDWKSAEAGFLRAIELDPRHVHARYWYAAYLLHFGLGRTDEAIAEMRRCLEIDPLSAVTKWNFWFVLYGAGWNDRIVMEIGDVAADHPDSLFAPVIDGFARLGAGDAENALESLDRATVLWRRNPWALTWYAEALIAAGRIDEAKAIHEELRATARTHFVSEVILAAVPAMLGDVETAMSFLRAAVDHREWATMLVKSFPWFTRIRSDARFADIVREAEAPRT